MYLWNKLDYNQIGFGLGLQPNIDAMHKLPLLMHPFKTRTHRCAFIMFDSLCGILCVPRGISKDPRQESDIVGSYNPDEHVSRLQSFNSEVVQATICHASSSESSEVKQFLINDDLVEPASSILMVLEPLAISNKKLQSDQTTISDAVDLWLKLDLPE